MRATKRIGLFSAALMLWGSGMSWAASPPARINYQGVLRDASGAPEDGAFDMTFAFYNTDGGAPPCPAVGGTLLLTDSQPGVTVTGGLFNVQLGGGALTPGAEGSLAEVFRDHAAVYLDVTVAGEVLCPRVPVISAAYSLNADHLDGKDATEFLDTSSSPQTKAGDLVLNDLTLNGNDLFFGEGARALNTASGLSVFAGESAADSLKLFAGPTTGHGFVDIRGDGALFLRAGNGFLSFGQDGGAESAQLDPAGNLQIDGALTATSGDFTSDVQFGGDLVFADGSIQTSAVSSLPPDTCFDNVGRFVVCGDGAVKDNLTGLFWLENANCFGILNWADANVAAALLGDGQCGLTDGSSPGDWRLPTEAEWQVIVDQANANGCFLPAVPDVGGLGCCGTGTCAFTGVVQSGGFWSSTTFASVPGNARFADLGGGAVASTNKTIGSYVWPVRAGP